MEPKRTSIVFSAEALSRLAKAVPEHAQRCLDTIESGGFEAWLVGGFVRDGLLGRTACDVDVATNALWQDVKRLCETAGLAVYETGTKHGTVSVIVDGHVIEVTTFRTEGPYFDHRRPSEVKPAETIVEDLARRDFTINAMAFHPRRGLVDPYGGTRDLNDRTICCVGDPRIRLAEDALRIMRAVRFASQLGFSIEEQTRQTVFSRRNDLELVAGERLREELQKFLCGRWVHDALLDYADVLTPILPEIAEMKDLDQRTRYHCYDVLEHTAYVIEFTPHDDVLGRWAALFHDMGKPETFFVDEAGVGHMHGHEQAGVGHLQKAAVRLRLPSKMVHDLKLLVRHHDFRPNVSQKSVRKLCAKLEFEHRLLPTMFNLMRADALAHAPEYHKRALAIDELEALYNEMREQGEALSPVDLAVSGSDLLELGLEPGPLVGELLDALFSEVAEDRLPNDRQALLNYANLLIASRNG